MVWVTILIAVFYACLLGIAAGLWILHHKKSNKNPSELPDNSFSILVPFRNEAKHLGDLVQSLNNQTQPKDRWECIFIDDHSTDQSVDIIQRTFNFKSRLITSLGTGKKAALVAGINEAKEDYIIQTDADCIAPDNWLSSINQVKGDQSNVIITGPVTIQQPNSILDHFQAMDMMAMMGMTFAGIKTGWWHMGNGANLAYPKSARINSQAASDSDQFASGDDMFLIESAIQNKQTKLIFNLNPEGIISTKACPDFNSFIQQRIRWATKNSSMKSPGLKIALGISLGFNVLLVILLIAALINDQWIRITVLLWIQKWIMDYVYLKSIAPFFNSKIRLPVYLVCATLYPFYVVLITLLSIFKRNYEWKGRIVR
ncbi:MAG: glycosyltransferase [Saprospiraceae bacterium]